MARLTQTTTSSTEKNLIFYKVTSSGLLFSVKSETSATIGLATKPKKNCAYEVVIKPYKCALLKNGEEVVSSDSYNRILFGNEFRKFWISWYNQTIVVGTEFSQLFKHGCEVKHLKFVSFYVDNEQPQNAEWRFCLSPVIETAPFKPLQSGEPHWVQMEDQIPDEAIIGGYKTELSYIIRFSFNGSLTPGVYFPKSKCGYIAWGGESWQSDFVEVLCGYNYIWVPTSNDRIPLGAVPGGYSEVGNETLYVGRAHHQGHLIVGKVQPSHCCCYFPYGVSELASKNFEILVVPQKNSGQIIISR